MPTLKLIPLALLLALPLTAGAQIYTWKDASGKVHYGDKPPLEKKVQTRELKSGKVTGGEPAATPEKKGEAATAPKSEGDNGSTGKSPEQAKAEADARQSLCDNAQKRLIQLEAEKGIIVTKNEKGESVPLVGEARLAEVENARKDVANWCK